MVGSLLVSSVNRRNINLIPMASRLLTNSRETGWVSRFYSAVLLFNDKRSLRSQIFAQQSTLLIGPRIGDVSGHPRVVLSYLRLVYGQLSPAFAVSNGVHSDSPISPFFPALS